MEQQPHPLLGILSQHPEYQRLCEALAKGEGPCGVFGLAEGNRGHMAAALASALGRPLLVVTANESAAEKRSEEIGRFLPCQHFPARDIPLTGAFTSSEGLEARRVAALCRLAAGQGRGAVLCASMEALMQRLAPPAVFLQLSRQVCAGDVIEPRSLLASLVEAGYVRGEVCESPGQVCLRGGYLDVYPIVAEYPVRIEFFDDEVDTLRTYDPLTQRSLENISSVFLPPACEMPLTPQARSAACKALAGRPGLEETLEALQAGGTPEGALRLMPLFYPQAYSLLDYMQDGVFLLDEPARLEESGKILFSQYLDQCAAAIQAGEAQPEQGEMLGSPLQAIKALDTPRTALFFALTRSYGLIGMKAPFRFETRPISRYVGDESLLQEDLAAWRKSGETVVIYAGPHGERLRQRLADLDMQLPA